MATRIAQDIGETNKREIVATTLVAFVFSSVLTGMACQCECPLIAVLNLRLI
jgi:hypothetical protein